MQHILTDEELLLHLSLNRITFLKFEEKRILAKKLDSSYSLALLSIEEICKILNKDFTGRVKWDGKENLHMAEVSVHYCKKLGIKIILNFDEEYPDFLRQISDPPYLLFCRGNEQLLKQKSVSVVGTRRISPEGRKAAKKFAYDAVLNGFNVVSGLAVGVDACAHQGAIDAYFDCVEKGIDVQFLGKTIAILPSSIDEIVPYHNAQLAGQILKCGGCIISEYEPKMGMASWHFVARNRIIAGMSPATVVIEAPTGSGALITADFALGYDREVMFHKTAFDVVAKRIAEKVQMQLERDFADGQISKYKMENTPERYLDAGAPVIGSFKEYCEKMEMTVNKTENPEIQGELF